MKKDNRVATSRIQKTFKQRLMSLAVKPTLRYIDRDPEKNVPKLLDWIIKLDKTGKYATTQSLAIKTALQNKTSNWNVLVKNLWNDVDRSIIKKVFENFVINSGIIGQTNQDKIREQYKCNVPWAILMDPTTACNLKCTGCWAAEYGNKLNLSFDDLDYIVEEGKSIGIYFFLFSGGEPLIRKRDIIRLCEKHNDCVFLAFTNGTLIDSEFASAMLRVKNFIPAISVEGFEDETDFRRGGGTFDKVCRAMDILKNNKLPFGISCCYTSKNVESIGSDAFFDEMIHKGAKFAWFFTYIPIGKDAVPELMVTPDQREYMYRKIREFRQSKPIFSLDFWNDGEFAGGCIAGGRRYMHINANGDIEPCAFIHYSDSNIKYKSFIEALQSPLFMSYKDNQPFDDNLLKPCPLLDNPDCLISMIKQSEATSTDLQSPEEVEVLCARTAPVAAKWSIVADRIWKDYPPERLREARNRVEKWKNSN